MADPITQVVQSLGLVTAYGYAKSKGYTGTEEEFAEAAAAIGQGAATASAAAAAASEDAETATTAAGTATTAAGNAEDSATAALQYKNSAETAATNAGTAQTAAAGSATSAAASAQAAATSEYNAGAAAGASSDYAIVSQDHAEDSEAWAVGTKYGNAVPSTADQYHNNAKYYAEQAEASKRAAASSETAAGTAAAAAQEWATGQDDPTDEPGPENNAAYYAAQAAAQAEAAAGSAASGIAALANEAQAFDATKAYTAGEYVLYNSVLYRFTADHAAGAWIGTDAVTVKIGPDITDLKSVLNDLAFETYVTKSKSGNVIEITDGILTAKITSDTTNLSIEHTGKNLIYTPFYYSGSRTVNGVTYTFNANGTILVNGTATANADTDILNTSSASRIPIKAGTYTFSDGNPFTEGQGYYTLIITNVGQYYLAGNGDNPNWGTGITITIPTDTTYALRYKVKNGNSANNVMLKPQLELGAVKTEWDEHTIEQVTLTNGRGKCNLFSGTNVLIANSIFTIEYCTDRKPDAGIYNLKEMGAVGDGTTDDTAAINSALITAAGKILFVPEGTYLFSGTLTVKSGTKVIGSGNGSVFKLANTYTLTPYNWRTDTGGQYAYRYPMITTEENSEGCIFENFAIMGQTHAFVDENEDGLALRGTQHIARNLTISKINYFPLSFSVRTCITPGWGITVINANTITVENCLVDECGYECIGIEDADTITIDSCKTGVGNQTSVQIHRNSNYCRIVNNSMSKTSSCMTMDADPLTPMAHIYISNNYILGVLNFVAGGENNVYIENNTIGAGLNCNNTVYRNTLFLRGNKISGRVGTYHDNAVITDNIINVSTGYYMIIHHGNKSVVANNLGIGSVTDITEITHE